MTAARSWMDWEGYALSPRLETGDANGIPLRPALLQLSGLFLWLCAPSIAASKYKD